MASVALEAAMSLGAPTLTYATSNRVIWRRSGCDGAKGRCQVSFGVTRGSAITATASDRPFVVSRVSLHAGSWEGGLTGSFLLAGAGVSSLSA